MPNRSDMTLRLAAFDHVRELARRHGSLPWSVIDQGFLAHGEKIRLANRARGIFKPRQMSSLLSIKTVHPRAGRKIWYDDQKQVHSDIDAGSETIRYAFQGDDPTSPDNRLLYSAWREEIPLIYFLATAPAIYQAIFPVYVMDWNASARQVELAVGTVPCHQAASKAFIPPRNPVDRKYALRTVRQRLHQDRFRQAVLAAYGGRCALSNFPEGRLLDAAHIVEDGDPSLGQPVVQNGLPLSKIHHGAFDADLIGIDPDFRIHVAPSLKAQSDGPILDAIKDLDGQYLNLPLREMDYPDPQRLEIRFNRFQANL